MSNGAICDRKTAIGGRVLSYSIFAFRDWGLVRILSGSSAVGSWARAVEPARDPTIVRAARRVRAENRERFTFMGHRFAATRLGRYPDAEMSEAIASNASVTRIF